MCLIALPFPKVVVPLTFRFPVIVPPALGKAAFAVAVAVVKPDAVA